MLLLLTCLFQRDRMPSYMRGLEPYELSALGALQEGYNFEKIYA